MIACEEASRTCFADVADTGDTQDVSRVRLAQVDLADDRFQRALHIGLEDQVERVPAFSVLILENETIQG